MPINWQAPLQTRNGCKVVYKGEFKGGDFSRYGIVTDKQGVESVETFTEDGRFTVDMPSDWDLVNVEVSE